MPELKGTWRAEDGSRGTFQGLKAGALSDCYAVDSRAEESAHGLPRQSDTTSGVVFARHSREVAYRGHVLVVVGVPGSSFLRLFWTVDFVCRPGSHNFYGTLLAAASLIPKKGRCK